MMAMARHGLVYLILRYVNVDFIVQVNAFSTYPVLPQPFINIISRALIARADIIL